MMKVRPAVFEPHAGNSRAPRAQRSAPRSLPARYVVHSCSGRQQDGGERARATMLVTDRLPLFAGIAQGFYSAEPGWVVLSWQERPTEPDVAVPPPPTKQGSLWNLRDPWPCLGCGMCRLC